MNRFWFPPLPLKSVFSLITSTGFALALAPPAIAYPPEKEPERIEEFPPLLETSESLLWSDSPQSLHHSGARTPPTSPWRSEDFSLDAVSRLRYHFKPHPSPNHLLNYQPIESDSEFIRLRQSPRIINSSVSLPMVQQGDQSFEDKANSSESEDETPRYSMHLLLAEQVSIDATEEHVSIDTTLEALENNAETAELPKSGVADSQSGEDGETSLDPTEISSTNIDSELGILRLRPLAGGDLETETSAALIDPELGVLRIRALPQSAEREAVKPEDSVFLQGYLSFFNGNNLLARTEPLPDTTFQAGLTLRAVPRLGPRTFFIGTAEGSLLKYAGHNEFNYQELGLSLGLYHWLTRRTYVDVGWRNQQFFTEVGGDRFLNDHHLRVAVGRTDHLTPDLKLDSAYQFQSSWSDPQERSRLTNRLTVGLSHPITPQLDASLSYQLALIDFTQQDRYDSYHQILAQLQLSLSEKATLTIFGGGRLGESTHSLIDFDSTLLGMSLVMNFALF